jgi:hypothetical protein
MKTLSFLWLGLLLTGAMACEGQDHGTVSFTGTVSYKNLEGGFYAIDADDGQKYMPINLPKEFAVDGLRVQVSARPKAEMVGIQMYGIMAEIVEISRLE